MFYEGGKPVTVLTSGAAGVQGKTVQLVSGAAAQQFVSTATAQQFVSGAAGQQFVTASPHLISSGQQVVMGTGHQMVVMQGAPPTASLTASDGPVTSDAALAQLAAEAGLLEGEGEGVTLMQGGQVDGGLVTPQELEVVDIERLDLNQYLNMFSSQLDGDPGEIDEEEANQNNITNTEQEPEIQTPSTPVEQEKKEDEVVEGTAGAEESSKVEANNSKSTNEVKFLKKFKHNII